MPIRPWRSGSIWRRDKRCPHARPCAGHPRLKNASRFKDVDGRDDPRRCGGSPGHDDADRSRSKTADVRLDRLRAGGYSRALLAPEVLMLNRVVAVIRANPAAAAALVVALGGAATILGAMVFQYGFGIVPCPLCLEQRMVYYVAIPLAVVVAIAALRDAPRALVRAGLGLIALAMLFGAGLALYHAGVEWKWWPGPQDCSGPLTPLGSRGLLEQLQDISIVRCDEAPWRFLGLS